jgi:choline dehydrogenase-like flavoprotein
MRSIDSRNTQAMRALLARAGCRLVKVTPTNLDGSVKTERQFGSAHHVGSCRMGDSPARGAVDADGELFGHPGIFVTDGAAIPAAPGVNPSLTILANAERIAARLCARYTQETGA